MDDSDLTHDAFLGGQVHAWQPREGFRTGVDAVLLAAAVPARAGQFVLELGCGAAVASLCLHRRVPELWLCGVEVQPLYAALARRNAAEAATELVVAESDLLALPAEVRNLDFDHVMMNPPYFTREAGSASANAGRDIARAGETRLDDWIEVATRRLRPGGVLTLIQRVERLPEVLAAMDSRLGAVQVLPVAPRGGQSAGLFLLRAIKGRKSPFRLRPTLVMHRGMRHGDAGDGYAPEVEAVLRHGQALAGFED
ncbi:tRNA1(Val) (adenine(37)-N6)-methyltransferase [Mangrovicoccus algicola]|uniref:Methyltransferase n=1 Tax=Mangrovicoccus algicola TaxID=2771008 RepID=A0A8J6YWT9_9RHOB|nr:methyltransferase [Mangrovicoccus algicola]MBE3639340.1 methyltransferase [Mangrovicoccus algicola]